MALLRNVKRSVCSPLFGALTNPAVPYSRGGVRVPFSLRPTLPEDGWCDYLAWRVSDGVTAQESRKSGVILNWT